MICFIYSLLPLTNMFFDVYCFCGFNKIFILFTYLFSAVLGLWCCTDFSLVAASRGYSLGVVLGLPIAVASLTDAGSKALRRQELGLTGSAVAAPGLWSTGSVVVVYQLSCFVPFLILLDQESNPCLLLWQANSLPLSPKEALGFVLFFKRMTYIFVWRATIF